MPQYLMLREVQDGQANLIGITNETTLTERQIADAWVTSRGDITEPVRLHFADVTDVKTVNVIPEVVRRASTAVVPPEEAFAPEDTPIVEVPSA